MVIKRVNNKKEIFKLILLIIFFLILNYNFLDKSLINFLKNSEEGFVERIVDGDTAIINGNSTRFLGINTPERGELYYKEAKSFLEELILNKTVRLEFGGEKYDLYKRKLAYVFLNETNVNSEIVKRGFANPYFLDNNKYNFEVKKSWKECIKSEKNLCEKSNHLCAKCIILKSIDIEKQIVILKNNCSLNCVLSNWSIKDEGRKKFIFKNFSLDNQREVSIIVGNKTSTKNELYWENETYVWTKTGDTLFLRDEQGKLVLWQYINRK